jgi:hypothetical protein
MLGRSTSSLKTKYTPLIYEGIYCMCDFRLPCGVNEIFTLLGCSSHRLFTSPLSSPYSFLGWYSSIFPFLLPSKSTFISVTVSCSTYFCIDEKAVFPSALITPAPYCLLAFYVPHPSFSFFSFSLPYFFTSFLPTPGLMFKDCWSS